jgi:hypothetical protein
MRSFLEPGEIEVLRWHFIVANHFQKFQSIRVLRCAT